LFLESLDISKNQISGELPDSLGLLSKLESLSIYDNGISGVMLPSICNLELDYLAADCDEIVCDCCTHCCDQVECIEFSPSPTSNLDNITGSPSIKASKVPSGSPSTYSPTKTYFPTKSIFPSSLIDSSSNKSSKLPSSSPSTYPPTRTLHPTQTTGPTGHETFYPTKSWSPTNSKRPTG